MAGQSTYIEKSLDHILPSKICWRTDKLGYEPPQQRWLEDKNIMEIIRVQQLKYDIPDRSMKSGKYTNSMDWKLLMSSYFTA